MKVAKLLLGKKNKQMSSHCIILVYELYLQKSVQYQSSDFVGQDEEGNVYKGIVILKDRFFKGVYSLHRKVTDRSFN